MEEDEDTACKENDSDQGERDGERRGHSPIRMPIIRGAGVGFLWTKRKGRGVLILEH